MKNLYLCVALFSLLICRVGQAWNHEISLGYGNSREVEYSYHNYGMFLNAKLYKFRKIDDMLIFTIDGSYGYWRTTTRNNKQNTLALSGAFRAYFLPFEKHKIRPYLLVSFGPTYLSERKYGERELGSNFAFQTTMGGGLEMMLNQKHGFDINLRLIHYCNAGLAKPNYGYEILYVVSIGYLF